MPVGQPATRAEPGSESGPWFQEVPGGFTVFAPGWTRNGQVRRLADSLSCQVVAGVGGADGERAHDLVNAIHLGSTPTPSLGPGPISEDDDLQAGDLREAAPVAGGHAITQGNRRGTDQKIMGADGRPFRGEDCP